MAQASQNQGYSGTRDMGSSARPSSSEAVSDLRDMAHETVDKASAQAERVAQSVTKQAEAVAKHAGEVGENVQHVADNLGTALQKSIRDQPMTTLAMAALMGVVLGALWKS